MLVTVGDVQGVEVLQGAPIIRKAHGGDAFQDLVQLLLARGLKAKWTPGVRRSPRNTSTRQVSQIPSTPNG